MSNYTKATNFLSKDSLTAGDPLKIIRGSEFDTEFEAIETAIATKEDSATLATTLADYLTIAAAGVITRLTSYDPATAAGDCVAVSAGFTVNTGLAAGTSFLIYNDSAAAITITQGSGVTLRLAGTTTTGNRTIAARGLASVWCNGTAEYLMSGAGVS